MPPRIWAFLSCAFSRRCLPNWLVSLFSLHLPTLSVIAPRFLFIHFSAPATSPPMPIISTALLTSFGTTGSGANINRVMTDFKIKSFFSTLAPRILAAKLLAPYTSPTIGNTIREALKTFHHFLYKPSVFGIIIAANASGDITVHRMMIASRTPNKKIVVTAVITTNSNTEITVASAKYPTVNNRAPAAMLLIHPWSLSFQSPAGIPPTAAVEMKLKALDPTTFDKSISSPHI